MATACNPQFANSARSGDNAGYKITDDDAACGVRDAIEWLLLGSPITSLTVRLWPIRAGAIDPKRTFASRSRASLSARPPATASRLD